MRHDRRSQLAAIGWPLIAGLVYFVVAYASIQLTRNSEGIATVWPASGVFLASLIQGRRYWLSIGLAVAIAGVLSNLVTGTSLPNAVVFTAANLVEGFLVAWLFSRIVRGGSIGDLRSAAWFFFHSVCGALVGASIVTLALADWRWPFFLSWFSTVLLGLLIVTPLSISVMRASGRARSGFSRRKFFEAGLALLLVLGSSLLVIELEEYPLYFLPVAAMMLATYRLGTFGAAASVATVALVGSLAISMGLGPAQTFPGDRTAAIYFFQFYLLVMIIASLPVAALLTQREAIMARLEDSNKLLEMAERTAKVGHWKIDLPDGSIFWSNEVYRMHGVPFEVKPTHSLLSGLVHPDDADRAREIFEHAIRNGEPVTLVIRIVRPDGELRHLESHSYPQTDASGAVVSIFGTFQDVTDKVDVLEQLEKAQHHAVLDAERSREIAETDELTGVASRRKIIDLLGEALCAAGEGGEELSVALLDIDHFKSINDEYGHPVGDQVLVKIAQCTRSALREYDRIGRLGGEEFLIIMRDTDRLVAADIVERVRREIENLQWEEYPGLKVTVSLGITSYKQGADETWMLQASDQALYEAKRGGRNCLRFAA
jgi:diguanylate cyclase (GGDEF)-like protein/PAS domain S-box-containing protein